MTATSNCKRPFKSEANNMLDREFYRLVSGVVLHEKTCIFNSTVLISGHCMNKSQIKQLRNLN